MNSYFCVIEKLVPTPGKNRVPTSSKRPEHFLEPFVYGFRYDKETDTVYDMIGPMQLWDFKFKKRVFTQEQVNKYSLAKGSLLLTDLSDSNHVSVRVITDPGFTKVMTAFLAEYRARYGREYGT